MGLHKGMTNNPNGRPKGSENRITKEVKDKINKLLADNFMNFQKDLEVLEPKDRLQVLLSLLPYVVPKLQSSSVKNENTEFQKVIIEGISTDELNEMLRED